MVKIDEYRSGTEIKVNVISQKGLIELVLDMGAKRTLFLLISALYLSQIKYLLSNTIRKDISYNKKDFTESRSFKLLLA